MPTKTTPPTRPLVVGNWKMNGTSASLAEIDAIAGARGPGRTSDVDCVICPPATLIHLAASRAGHSLGIGAQNCATAPLGAHTGDIAAEQLREAGARYVIFGHSERRCDHRENDAVVRAKVGAALRAGLVPIVCVGETREERDAWVAFEVVGRQLDGSLPSDPAELGSVVVAYEPVWAIGTGLTPTPDDVARMHRFIRSRLVSLSPDHGMEVPILYGGSVKPGNAAELLALDEVGGALVGGASLQACDFLAIANAYRRTPATDVGC